MDISKHIAHDWCHVCGKRKQPMADVWYPANAETALTLPVPPPNEQYLRVCAGCAIAILRAMVDQG